MEEYQKRAKRDWRWCAPPQVVRTSAGSSELKKAKGCYHFQRGVTGVVLLIYEEESNVAKEGWTAERKNVSRRHLSTDLSPFSQSVCLSAVCLSVAWVTNHKQQDRNLCCLQ